LEASAIDKVLKQKLGQGHYAIVNVVEDDNNRAELKLKICTRGSNRRFLQFFTKNNAF